MNQAQTRLAAHKAHCLAIEYQLFHDAKRANAAYFLAVELAPDNSEYAADYAAFMWEECGRMDRECKNPPGLSVQTGRKD